MTAKVDLHGLELTTQGTPGIGRIYEPDYAILANECGAEVDTQTITCIGRIMGWPESRIDAAITDGLRAGAFRPRD
jgi:hypothetical protein